eukprot:m.618302 g.618302  ORF g.618302 m.618302 type:complete len:436 (+) comp22527_c2_seq1:210-1517(+)
MAPMCLPHWRWTILLGFAAGILHVTVKAQDPTSGWRPRFTSLGPYCYNGAKNPNMPSGHHDGGCGCENTPLRIRDQMYMMESTGHGCDDAFPGYNTTKLGDCSFFRIRDLESGAVIANVSQSLRHSFCSAVADHTRETLWVFCAAISRNQHGADSPCGTSPYHGCYVGAWKASFDDLTAWSDVSKAVNLPDGYGLFNNDVALVSGSTAAAVGAIPGLPKHQAVMIMENREDDPHHRWLSPFVVNVGTDGDLTRNWQLLNLTDFAISGFAPGATGEGTGDAPTIRFDAEQGYYYSIGGGWITNGPARSRNLTAGSWEVSQYAPMAVPDARAVAAGLPPADKNAGLNKNFYQEIWSPQILPPSEETELQGWLDNTSVWNWGATDVDVCCGDGKAPSYILNTLSRQGAPSGVTEHTVTFARLGRVNMSLNEWFRSYFD